jgi:hypothetical protein
MEIKDLIVPPEIKTDINPLSGYINSTSKFYGKNAITLFNSNVNIKYLQVETVSMLTYEPYIQTVLDKSQEIYSETNPKRIAQAFQKNDYRVFTLIQGKVAHTRAPFAEDSLQKNVVMQLSAMNKDFVYGLSNTLILTPNCIDPNFYNTDEKKEWDYDSSSYSDGTWHPEYLFANNKRNEREGYWNPGEVSFDTDPPGQPFHARENHYSLNSRTTRSLYSGQNRRAGSPGPGPGNKYKYTNYAEEGFKSTNGLFPRWRDPSPAVKQIHKNIDEGLREGGREDRRVQETRKHDLSHLFVKSTN